MNFERLALCVALLLVQSPKNAGNWKIEGAKNSDGGPEALASRFGFLCESHQVTTEDGYILTLHRISGGKKMKTKPNGGGVLLLFPGLLASSETWLFRGADKDLPYVFADNGFDVWICNPRGNFFSRKHRSLDPDTDAHFWNYSIHEHGVFDLPASVDYALKVTKQNSLFFIGHSIGASAFFIMCSLKPEYNKKVRLATTLAAAAYVTRPVTPLTQILLSLVPLLSRAVTENGIYELFPRGGILSVVGQVLCRKGAITRSLCVSMVFAVVGRNNEQFNYTLFPEALNYYPSGSSFNVMTHLYDIFAARRFGPISGDTSEEYDMKMVTAPVALYYADGDALISKEDNELLAKRLPNVVGLFKVPYHNFNHIDFMWSIDSKILLYDRLVNLMKQY
ncbi:hypothetical protein PPYR_03074 [Photinus pyralis]|uniref:Lipase n=2 Tax=Photinus pyralis TaxID=7054 RepID=A0A5N4A1R7_PHOPY|nr:lipase 1-like [Photinus pyralis]KAB0791274.1 hypothetical protein PPYR_03074 [Photinus pyralis]